MVSRRVEEACSLAGEAAQKYMKSIVMEDSRAGRVRQFEEQLCDGKQHGWWWESSSSLEEQHSIGISSN